MTSVRHFPICCPSLFHDHPIWLRRIRRLFVAACVGILLGPFPFAVVIAAVTPTAAPTTFWLDAGTSEISVWRKRLPVYFQDRESDNPEQLDSDSSIPDAKDTQGRAEQQESSLAEFSDETQERDAKLFVPDWVERGSYLDGEDQVELVIGEPCPSQVLAARELEQELTRRVQQVLDQWFGTGAGKQLAVDLEFIKSEWVEAEKWVVVPYDDAHTRELKREIGDTELTFYRGFAQIRIPASFRTESLQRLEELETQHRLVILSRLGVIAFATLLAAFVFFRLNHVTRGFYTARLLSLIAVALLLVLALIIGW